MARVRSREAAAASLQELMDKEPARHNLRLLQAPGFGYATWSCPLSLEGSCSCCSCEFLRSHTQAETLEGFRVQSDTTDIVGTAATPVEATSLDSGTLYPISNL